MLGSSSLTATKTRIKHSFDEVSEAILVTRTVIMSLHAIGMCNKLKVVIKYQEVRLYCSCMLMKERVSTPPAQYPRMQKYG